MGVGRLTIADSSDPASAAKNVAQVIIDVIKSRTEQGHKAVLGLSADDATRDIYAELAVRNRAGEASFDVSVVSRFPSRGLFS